MLQRSWPCCFYLFRCSLLLTPVCSSLPFVYCLHGASSCLTVTHLASCVARFQTATPLCFRPRESTVPTSLYFVPLLQHVILCVLTFCTLCVYLCNRVLVFYSFTFYSRTGICLYNGRFSCTCTLSSSLPTPAAPSFIVLFSHFIN